MPLSNDRAETYEGTWHIPGFDLDPIGGIYTPTADPSLRAFGGLWPTRFYGSDYMMGDLPPILGRCAGRPMTLLSPRPFGTVSHGAIVSETRIYSPTAIVGAHFEKQSDARFVSARFELSGTPVLLDSPDFLDEHGPDSHTISYRESAPKSVSIPAATLELRDSFTGHSELWRRELRRAPFFRLDFDKPISVDEIEYRYIRPIRYLISLATNNPSACVHLTVEHSNVVLDAVGARRPLTVRRADEESLDMHVHEPASNYIYRVFDLNAYPFENLVPRWFSVVDELGAVADLIFSTDDTRGYVENQFFDLVSAVEGLCNYLRIPSRKHRLTPEQDAYRKRCIEEAPDALKSWVNRRLGSTEEPSMQERISALVQYCGDWLESFIGRSGAWQETVARFRNDVAHPLGNADVFTEHRLTGRLVANLRAILRLSLLRLLRLSSDDCHDLFVNTLQWTASFDVGPRDFPEVYT